MTFVKICFLTFILFTTVSAHGICQMNLAGVNSRINLNSVDFPTLDVRVEKISGDCEKFFVTLDNGGAASYVNRVLHDGDKIQPIQFYKDAGRTRILKDEFETTIDEVITGDFNGKTAAIQNFAYYPVLQLPPNQYATVGDYSGNYTLKLFSGTPATRTLVDSKIVNFQFRQDRTIEVSLVSTGAPFDASSSTRVMDFGHLKKNAALGADLVLKYNSGYSISISSLNGGRLKHSTASRFIPYAVKIDGINKSISAAPTVVKEANGFSAERGARMPIRVIVGDVAAAAPGKYSDIISITVASHE